MSSVRYWGGATVEVDVGGTRFVIDPYLAPVPLDTRYAFVTHEHYDHFFEPALRRLSDEGNLEMVLASPSCFVASQLESPTSVAPEPQDLRWLSPDRSCALYPKIRPAGLDYFGPCEIYLGDLRIVGVSSGENPQLWKDGSLIDPSARGRESSEIYGHGEAAPCPTVGYFVEHVPTGFGVFHPGDFTHNFPELTVLQGAVDILFLPIGKLNGEEASLVELVGPRYVVPIHYRLPDEAWPVPLNVQPSDITTADWESGHPLPGVRWDGEEYLRDIERLIRGHWYPSPTDPLDFTSDLAEELTRRASGAEVRMLHPGQSYELDGEGRLLGEFAL